MKNKIKYLIIILGFVINANGQDDTCWKRTNTITTDWRKHTSNGGNGQSQNAWNWTQKGRVYPVYNVANQSTPNFYAELPFYCSQPSGSGSCNNPNCHIYELAGQDPSDQDIWPEDGWELIVHFFGEANGAGAEYPYFMLYNKHTGKLKTYIMVIGQKNSVNSAVISFQFDNSSAQRGLFGYAKPITQNLFDFETGNTFKSINSINVTNNSETYQWLVSEIVLDFDPCACLDNSYSKNTFILVKFNTINTTTINAKIEGTLSSSEQRMNSGSINSGQNKTSFIDMAVNVATAGYNSFNKFDYYKSKMNDFYDKTNSSYQNKLSDAWFKSNVEDPYAGVFTTAQKNDM